MAKRCISKRLSAFLSKRLDVDDRLEFLTHVERCSRCWIAVYEAVKAQHPHYYKLRTSKTGISAKKRSRLKKLPEKWVEVA